MSAAFSTSNETTTTPPLLESSGVPLGSKRRVQWQQQQQQQQQQPSDRGGGEDRPLLLLRTPSRVAASSIAEARLREALAPLPMESTRHVTVSAPLFGAVPVGQVLADLGFHAVETMTFVPGGITRLLGVPDSVTTLICPHNSLTAASLVDLGPELRVLKAAFNQIDGDVDVSGLASLEELDLGHNTICRFVSPTTATTLFPNSLQHLVVSHNRLCALDLQSCPGLRRLDARFNPRPFRVVHAPPALAAALPEGAAAMEYVAATTTPFRPPRMLPPPGVQSHSLTATTKDGGEDDGDDGDDGAAAAGASSSSSSSSGGAAGRRRRRLEQEPLLLTPMRLPAGHEARVRGFFEEKKAYEELTIKRHLAAGAPPVCTKCNRSGGGMLFSGRNQKYTARCLAAPSPCAFAITINRGSFAPLRAHATRLRARVLAARESMIKLQFDALLGYKPQADVDREFPSQVARYNGLFERFQEYERRADEYYFSTAKAARCAALRREIAERLEEVRTLVAERRPEEEARAPLADDHRKKWVAVARAQKGIAEISAQLGRETYPGRGCLTNYDKAVGRSVIVLADVHTREEAQYNVGAPL